jgi:hypothetical protein
MRCLSVRCTVSGEAAQSRAEASGAFENYPYLAEIATKLPESGHDNPVEFEWGSISSSLEHRCWRAPGP